MANAQTRRRAADDVALQRTLDRRWPISQENLHVRYLAIIDAAEAGAAGAVGAHPALRQSLVDMAAVCENLAAELPAPRVV